jgi:hypothetical protein
MIRDFRPKNERTVSKETSIFCISTMLAFHPVWYDVCKECGDAFRHRLYLSATMTVGAASESLWMELGNLVCSKNLPGITKLATELNNPMPNIGRIIEPTWQTLMTNHFSLDALIFNPQNQALPSLLLGSALLCPQICPSFSLARNCTHRVF